MTSLDSTNNRLKDFPVLYNNNNAEIESRLSVLESGVDDVEAKYIQAISDLNAKFRALESTLTKSIGEALGDTTIKISNGKVYILGIGGFDGVNDGQTGVLSLQEVIDSLGNVKR